MNKTIDFYDNNSSLFIKNTQDLTFTKVEDEFLKYIPKNGRILDFGCGSGRDSKYFLGKGYEVDATDGSIAMVKAATKLTGLPIKHLMFNELDEHNVYDGIWACASILHCSKEELPDVINRMMIALKDDGVIYTSFKYGNTEHFRGERFYTDLNEDSIEELFEGHNVKVIKKWTSKDIRPSNPEKWVNIILQKIDIIQHIIKRAKKLEATKMQGLEEPEIGINDETQMITISRYNPESSESIYIEDICNINDVDLEQLLYELSKANILYCL